MSANQTRRRTDLGAGPVPGNARPKLDSTLPYQGRELGQGSIRLVKIQPAAHDDDPVVCTLNEVAFGSRPKFEALSYMWGTELAGEPITLNGFAFEVKRNLLDALLFLRRQVALGTARQPFWIDAICINQKDVAERNRQLPIMEQIYSRAATVAVWLGNSRYTEFQQSLAGAVIVVVDEGEKAGEDSPQDSHSGRVQQEMVRYLRTDPYWERLWIPQEIGRANKLRVCFGNETRSWEDFMHLIAMHNSDGTIGPLRLDRVLRQEKYSGSHTLKRLLEDHKDAKCSDPKDNVYGLVGLATDAAEFPMDYKKSLYEVWNDTMVYLNQWNLFKDESQILSVGALAKSLLMADCGDPLSQISRPYEGRADSTELIDNPSSALVFHLEAVVLGCIAVVGPPASDIVARPSMVSEWRGVLQKLFSADEMGPTHREHDKLLQVLLESDESEVEKKCFNRPSTVVWEDRNWATCEIGSIEYSIKSSRDYIKQVEEDRGVIASRSTHWAQENTDRLSSIQPRLYLAKRAYDPSWNPPPRRMGIASSLIQPGDLVCWIRWSRRALLVRMIDGTSFYAKLRAFGTALTADDIMRRTRRSRM
ncbi:heterokaryon incompatibility protein-domain-containing protein [Coniochaeta sp. 2T2.1]|nr:heterokaryon incompatibility protein-domain-containing protein [Coniochaeta sp. 2T2.1]